MDQILGTTSVKVDREPLKNLLCIGGIRRNECERSNSVVTMLKLDPVRDIAMLAEEMLSDSVDSDRQDILTTQLPFRSNSISRLSPVYYSENEDYTLNSGHMYLRHPDSYLPPLSNLSETEGDISTNNKSSKSKADLEFIKRKLSVNSEDVYLSDKSPYSSNISVQLCEIDDSELEEFLPKRREKTIRDEL